MALSEVLHLIDQKIFAPNTSYQSSVQIDAAPTAQPKVGFTSAIIEEEILSGKFRLQYIQTHIATELHIGSLSEMEAKRLEQEAAKVISHHRVG